MAVNGSGAMHFLILICIFFVVYSQDQAGTATENNPTGPGGVTGTMATVDDLNVTTSFRSWTGRPAVVETTPAVCYGGVRCGFQIYDQFTRELTMPFISYCGCPEGTECVKVGDDMMQRFYFYKCLNSTEDVTEMEIIADSNRDTDVQASQSGREERARIVETATAVEATVMDADIVSTIATLATAADASAGDVAGTEVGDAESSDLKDRVGFVARRAEL